MSDFVKKKIFITALLIFMVCAIVYLNGVITMRSMCKYAEGNILESSVIRKLNVSNEQMKQLYYTETIDGSVLIVDINKDILNNMIYSSIYSFVSGKECSGHFPGAFKTVCSKEMVDKLSNALYAILTDVRYFPVAADAVQSVKTSFENSWGAARTYGGDRNHEGTDIMAGNNQRGYFPVVSMTDGIVENIGWLELGGYRIGIRSPSGGYYYYAHMCEYADGIKEGSQVKAGTILGTMGDSGYGKEGTTGQFDVHLHIGIYYTVDGKEISYNPYYILKMLEPYQLSYAQSSQNY